MIKLSVCVPIYGVEQYIEKCARSLFEQTQKDDIEFIFINDKTPDKSIEILKEVLRDYPERKEQVKIIEHTYNSGVGAARLSALKEARGEYVINCDSDDYVSVDMYELLLNKAYNNNSDVVICDYYEDYGEKKIKITFPENKCSEQLVIDMMEGRAHCGVWNKMIRRVLYLGSESSFVHGIDMWEDVGAIIPALIKAKSIAYVNKPLYYYNQQNISSYTHSIKEKSLDNMKVVVKRLETFLLKNNPTILPSLNYLKITVKL
ncbi:MAG: glycosyltransferase, partial [Ruminococcus sp.]|nr:glycosyltransferase [Ruminococcus sp.]